MKKILIALLLLISLTLSFTGCGEFVPAENPGGKPPEDNSGDEGGQDKPDDGTGDTPATDKPFTVKVLMDGKLYIPTSQDGIKVRWSDGIGAVTEGIGMDGVASVSGLDGDYTVTLLNVPDGYFYNPNIYKATNDRRDITIELVGFSTASGSGSSLYSCSKLNKTGIYRTKITKAGQIVYYEFTPRQSGVYQVESMVDVSANMYNPILKVYTGTTAAKFEQNEVNGGGISSTYTQNFLYKISVDEEFLGNTYTFAIRTEGKDAVYPTYVDFSVSYLGAAGGLQDNDAPFVMPSFIPKGLNYFDMVMYDTVDISYFSGDELNNPTYIWLKSYREYLAADMAKYGLDSAKWTDSALRVDGKYVFTEDGYRLNPSDGYYHLYDEVKYAEFDGWGPVLYAEISKPCKFMSSSISTMEYAGNKALTVENGEENYKLFVEGSYELTLSHGDSGPYLCNSTCDCYKTYDTARNAFLAAIAAYETAIEESEPNIQDYVDNIIAARENLAHTNGGACYSGCADCNKTCRSIPDGYALQMGYANIAIDGRVPVTEELKDFLQKLSESQRYFSDGNGWVEIQGYTAFEESQWLFACGYFKP